MMKHFSFPKYILPGVMFLISAFSAFSQKTITGFWESSIEYQCSGGWKNSSSSVLLSSSFGDKVTGMVLGGQIEINSFFTDGEYPFEITGQNGCIRSGKLQYREFAGREYLTGEWSYSGGDNAMWGTGLCCRGKIELWRDIKTAKSASVLQPASTHGDNQTKTGTEAPHFDGTLVAGKSYVLKNVLFGLSSDVLLPEAKQELDQLYKVLKDSPEVVIRLEGHTDITGSPKANMQLSKRRVKAAKKYLVQKGIPGKRIKLKWYGATRPLLTNGTVEERKINRRVEMIVLENQVK